MTLSEKRQHKRLESSLKVQFVQAGPTGKASNNIEQTGRLVNISQSGLLLHHKNNIPAKSVLEVIMGISGTTVRLTCQHIYCTAIKHDLFETGLQIKAIEPQEKDTFFSYITELEKNDQLFQSLRPKISGFTDVIKRITAEHKIITRYVVVIREMLGADTPDYEHLGTLLTLMKKDLIPHFRIEDKLVFKIASQYLGSQSASVMARLSEEHRDVIKELDILTDQIQTDILFDKPVPVTTHDAIKNFIEKVIQHARFELTELFPLIENNLETKEKIMKKILELSRRDIQETP